MTMVPASAAPTTLMRAGGRATEAGISFQAAVATWLAVHILAQLPVGGRFGINNQALPIAIRLETGVHLDDIEVTQSDNGALHIQCKTSANLSSDLSSPLAKTVGQLARWLAGETATGTFPDPQSNIALLAVRSDSPMTLDSLETACRAFDYGGGWTATREQRNQAERNALDVLREAATAAWIKRRGTKPQDDDLVDLARMFHIARFRMDEGDSDWREASRVLGRHLYGGDSAGDAPLRDLKGIMRDLIGSAAPADRAGLLLALRRRGHNDIGAPSYDAATVTWQSLRFERGRDIGPALLGRDLGPGDATACPRLVEATALLDELRRAYSVRLVGVPGSGKSVCAYQAASSLVAEGWNAVQLRDVGDAKIDLKLETERPTVFIIDGGHRMFGSVLLSLEQQAGPNKYLISTHSVAEEEPSYRGAIRLDEKRAVRTIASSLRADLSGTLKAVRRIDDRVGGTFLQEDLGKRIDTAETDAKYPWHFCFMLGGGWRRTQQVADASRAQKADLVLAAIASLQVVSRDGPTDVPELVKFLAPQGLLQPQIEAAVHWLVAERAVISQRDLRCPHQRFSVAALREIFKGSDEHGRLQIQQICRSALWHLKATLAGCRNLLHELNFAEEHGLRFRCWIDSPTLLMLQQRSFEAETAEERMHACFLLAELGGKGQRAFPWSVLISSNEISLLGSWISSAEHPLGFGMYRLLNNIWNDDEMLALAIVESSDPRLVARIVSAVDYVTAYSVGQMINRIGLTQNDGIWHKTFKDELDHDQILKTVSTWPEGISNVDMMSKYCWALAMHDHELGLRILDLATPLVQRSFANDPVNTFRAIDDIVSCLLRTWDPLDGRGAPEERAVIATRRLLEMVMPERVAEQMSIGNLREMMSAAYFLSFLHRMSPAKAQRVRALLDWSKICVTLKDHWSWLPHEAEIFLVQASLDTAAAERVSAVLVDHAPLLKNLPLKLAFVSSVGAVAVLEQGNKVNLHLNLRGDWRVIYYVAVQIYRLRPDLLSALVLPYAAEIAKVIQSDPTIHRGIDEFIRLLYEAAPAVLNEILMRIDPVQAEKNWAESLKRFRSSVAALLVDASLDLTGEIAQVAFKLSQRFPKK